MRFFASSASIARAINNRLPNEEEPAWTKIRVRSSSPDLACSAPKLKDHEDKGDQRPGKSHMAFPQASANLR